jgi:hypothetical protein
MSGTDLHRDLPDDTASLGPVEADFRYSRLWLDAFILGFWLVLGVMCLAWAWALGLELTAIPGSGWLALAGLVVGPCAIVGGRLYYRWRKTYHDTRVVFYRDGLVFRQRGLTRLLRWTDVSQADYHFSTVNAHRPSLLVYPHEGDAVVLTQDEFTPGDFDKIRDGVGKHVPVGRLGF